nr:hypothetical protein [uncultured Cohaesibacter sp.]
MNNQTIINLHQASLISAEEQALADFIHDQKNSELMQSGEMPNWDIDPQDPKWDLSNITSSSSSTSKKPNILFYPINGKTPYPSHWQDFLKSLIIAEIRKNYDIGKSTSSSTIIFKTKNIRKFIDCCIISNISSIINIQIIDIENIIKSFARRQKTCCFIVLKYYQIMMFYLGLTRSNLSLPKQIKPLSLHPM